MVTLASIFLALYSRLARASMLEVLGADYVRTARAKGVPERTVLYKHALRNALGPVVTVAGLQFSAVISGAVVVETVFSWPGLGTLALQSILARDTPTIMGILFFSSLVVIVVNILTDIALRVLDPAHQGRIGGARGRRRHCQPTIRPTPEPKVEHPLRRDGEDVLPQLRGSVGLLLLIAILLFTFVGPYVHTTDPFEMVWAPFSLPGRGRLPARHRLPRARHPRGDDGRRAGLAWPSGSPPRSSPWSSV